MLKTIYKTQEEKINTDFDKFLAIGVLKNYFSFSRDKGKVIYNALGKTYNFRDSEEKVRIEYYFDLIEKYKYPITRIEFEVEMPDNAMEQCADIVVFEDDAKIKPYIAVECRSIDSDIKAVEKGLKEAIIKAKLLGAKYAICTTIKTKKAVKMVDLKGFVNKKSFIEDIPVFGVRV